MTEADRLIKLLDLAPHPEGGYFRETFRDCGRSPAGRDAPGHHGRSHSTAIYFLLKAGEVSRWHRVDAAEVWHFYRGAPLELRIGGQIYVLGPNVD
ncbi:MAG TPA: cupin domain-containing protein, partial [Rhizomicrobium sp.]|nr:cupin domain-containing protein [Rhizomicrobium sp.]